MYLAEMEQENWAKALELEVKGRYHQAPVCRLILFSLSLSFLIFYTSTIIGCTFAND
jgi:hypothetical protein